MTPVAGRVHAARPLAPTSQVQALTHEGDGALLSKCIAAPEAKGTRGLRMGTCVLGGVLPHLTFSATATPTDGSV